MTTYLSTPCAILGCGHTLNWHRAACLVGSCACRGFVSPDAAAEEQTQDGTR
jgi:hypothetical protein